MDLYNQWLHHAQQPAQQEPSSAGSSDTARSVDDEWKDRQTLSQPSTTPNTMDLSEFSSMSEAAPGLTTNGNDSASASSSGFGAFSSEGNMFMPAYNGLSYGNSSWLNPPSTVPLSSYSTLNGATSSGQQQQPAQMMIDPALLGDSNYYPTFSSQPSPQSPQSRNVPSFPFLSSQYYPQPSSSTAPTETLTPQSLHAPSPPPSSIQPISPASFYATPQGPSEEKKRNFRSSIQPLLSSSAFTGAQAVHTLVDRILDFGIGSVEPSMRLEILTKIRDYSGKPYLRAWAENENAMKVTKKWLTAGSSVPKDDPLKETVMPILHIIQRLPLTLESLAEHKLGKMILKLTTDPVPAIKDMASDIEHQWRQLMSSAAAAKSANQSEDRATKKRKIGDPSLASKSSTSAKPSTSTSTPAVRKTPAASITTKAATAVKKETKTVVAVNANTSKSDSSFFSSKPNKKLPSFKKAPPPPPPTIKKDEPPQPPINAFAVALEGLKRKESPAIIPTPVASANSSSSATSTPPAESSKLMKNGKPRKSVTWAPPEKLEMVKLIERAVYDDDPTEGEHAMHSLRELDRGEGAALHAHLFEELVDWSEPIPFELPPEVETFEYGSLSTERAAQEQREQTALAAVYMSSAHIPDSPSEPSISPVADDEMDKDVKIMICGPELDAVFFSDTEMPAHPHPNQMLHHLHPQHEIGPGGLMDTMTGQSSTSFAGVDQAKLADIAKMLSHVSPNLFSINQNNGITTTQPPPPQQSAWGGEPEWGNQWSAPAYPGTSGPYPGQSGLSGDYNAYTAAATQSDANGGVFNGGRGRGGGYTTPYKKVPCRYFNQGRCSKGDHCTYSHELS